MRIALITGATAGIGEATAQRLASEGFNLIITGRRKDRLEALTKLLVEQHKIDILPLCFDVRDKKQVEQQLGKLPEKWQAIDMLVNNAGLSAGLDPLQDGAIDDWEQMIDTNIKGLLYVSKMVMPHMIARKKGHIINIGSIAGREVYPNGNVYCSTKHAVDALTKGMRLDLLPHGIRVSQVAPGMVETEFSVVRFHGDRERAGNVYKGFTPLSAADIADLIAYMANAPEHVNIADVLILPAAQGSIAHVAKCV